MPGFHRRPRHLYRCFSLLLLLCLAAAGCNKPATSQAKTNESGGDKTKHQVEVQTLDYAGIEKLIAAHKGKVVVVDIWSTSCPPCVKAFPGLVALHKKYGADKVACVSLSLDYEGGQFADIEKDKARVARFLTEQGATFDNVLASEPADEMFTKLDINAPPTILVYDREGELRGKFVEASDEDTPPIYDRVGKLVQELLAG